MVFKSLELNEYVKGKYGNNAYIKALDDHLYSLRMILNGKEYHLDLNDAAKWFFGNGNIAVATGVHKYDWRAFNINEWSYNVLPILVVSKNLWGDINKVRQGKHQLLKSLSVTQKWYERQLGQTFQFPSEVIVLDSPFDSVQWNYFAKITNRKDSEIPDPFPRENNREILELRLRARVSQMFGNVFGHNVIFFVAPFTALGSRASQAGAICRGNFVAEPPSILESSTHYNEVIYAAGHELGHAFGLPHTCETYPGNPNCRNSIMENPNRAKMTFLPEEKNMLVNNSYIN